MFTTFLIGLAAVVGLWLGSLLLRRRDGVASLRPHAAPIAVAATATSLVALGLWMI